MDRRVFLQHSLAATTATALGTRPNVAAAQSAKPLTIALFIRNLVNPVWTYAGLGADRAAQEIGGVTIAHATPTKSDDIDEQTGLVEDAIAIRSVAYLALTFDHRLIDGALADQFTGKVKSILENWSEEVL